MPLDINTIFCRRLLAVGLEDLTANERKNYHKNASVLCTDERPGYKQYLFEWPKMATGGKKYTWEGSADNTYDARYHAIAYWLEHHSAWYRART